MARCIGQFTAKWRAQGDRRAYLRILADQADAEAERASAAGQWRRAEKCAELARQYRAMAEKEKAT